MKKLLIVTLLIVYSFVLWGCGNKASREFDRPDNTNYTLSGNLYENNTYGFIMVKPAADWEYKGKPSPGLATHSDQIVRFEKEVTPTQTAFLEISAWDISSIVTAGTTLLQLASANETLLANNATSFPNYNLASAIAISNVNSQTAYSFEFISSSNTVAGISNQQRCIGLRDVNNYYYIFLGGTNSEDNWPARNTELKEFIDSFYFK